MLTRWRSARADRDAGMSLIELMVGMGLATLVGALALVFFVGSTSQADRVSAQSLDASDVRVAADRIAAELRTADTPSARPGFAAGRFDTLTASRLVFYSNIDSTSRAGTAGRTPPTKLDIYVENGALKEKRYAPTTKYTDNYPSSYNYANNYPTNPTSTSVLLPTLGSSSVFSYCTIDTDPTVKCTPAATATSIAAVNITLSVPAKSGNAAQTLKTTVAITGATS
ncbi:hypothetical protein SAMN05443575_4201 [Jatrophihabitans endophyticus]|uniref:Prepilin-type N-terminal cleavage/methylation domain-containing protein n=1 Tax=Jatrophihabitans endophyticus TaxID=1206085 RepID=A0A1M5UFV3_9ACTN|nr:type II secretion system protein [Jatrophihabitans endophyticus]SHH61716.1 hypothetical protein SAMN05443575_4201 [Jatrophihabitans endophyticus]